MDPDRVSQPATRSPETRHAGLRRRRRLEILLILGAFAAMGPIAMDMYIPILPAAAADLDVATPAAQLTITTFLVGLAAGQLVVGPLSDIFGRRLPLAIGAAAYTISALACGVAQSVPVLASARFAQGLTASAGIVISRAIIRDIYTDRAVAKSYSRLFFLVAFSAILCPLAGTQLLRVSSWRIIFVIYGVYGITLLALVATRLPETLPRHRCGQRTSGFGVRIREPLRDRRFIAYAFCIAGISGALILMVAGSPFVLRDVYETSPQFYGYLIFVSAIAMMIATQANVWIIRRMPIRRVLGIALLCVVAGGILIATLGSSSLVAFCAAFLVVLSMWGFVAANATSLAMRTQSANAGSASAHLGIAQYGTGAVAAPLVGIIGTRSATGVGIALAGFALLGCVAVLAATRQESRSIATD